MRCSILFGALLLGGCATTSTELESKTMNASWYHHGTRTANGERFVPDGMTAAHKTLPFGTKLHLTRNGRSVIVRINDRGPFIRGRQLDLSRGAARSLGCIEIGHCIVHYRIVQ